MRQKRQVQLSGICNILSGRIVAKVFTNKILIGGSEFRRFYYFISSTTEPIFARLEREGKIMRIIKGLNVYVFEGFPLY